MEFAEALDLEEKARRVVTLDGYVDGLLLQFKNKFLKRKLVCRFNEEVAEKLGNYS